MIKVGYLISHDCMRFDGHEPVEKSLWHKKLLPVRRAELHPHPMAEFRRTLSGVDNDIKYSALHNANEFVLGVRWRLIMQAADRVAFSGIGFIVLNEAIVRKVRLVFPLGVGFEEISAIILEAGEGVKTFTSSISVMLTSTHCASLKRLSTHT